MKRRQEHKEDRFPLVITQGNITVRIYRQDRSAEGKGVGFLLADHSTGKRRLRAFSDLDAAKSEATRLLNLLSTGQTHAATFSNQDAAAYGRSLALLAETGVEIETAAAIVAEAVRIVRSPTAILDACRLWESTHAGVTPFPVRDAAAQYVCTKEGQGASNRYVQDLRHRLGKLSEAFHVNVDAVATPELQRWIDGLKASPQTMRNFRTVLTGFFGFCRSRGWCSSNPVDGLTLPKIKGEEEPEIFTAGEFNRLLNAASNDILPCLVLGGFCGLRSAEIERLHWEDVHLASGEVVIKRGTAKTKSRRIVPICEAAKAWLSGYKNPTGPIWKKTHEDFYQAQADTAAAAGIAWRANGLRHGYASHRLAVTGDAVRVAHEMGNSAGIVHGHYKSLVSESEGKAWFSITPSKPANITTMPAPAVAGGKERVA